jgi:hypothetical protein
MVMFHDLPIKHGDFPLIYPLKIVIFRFFLCKRLPEGIFPYLSTEPLSSSSSSGAAAGGPMAYLRPLALVELPYLEQEVID